MSETIPTLAICGELTIFTAREQKARLLAAIAAAPATIDIDLAEVTEIDTAGIQLMLFVKREAAAAGKRTHFIRHSNAVLDLIDLCGLAGQLGDPALPHPQP